MPLDQINCTSPSIILYLLVSLQTLQSSPDSSSVFCQSNLSVPLLLATHTTDTTITTLTPSHTTPIHSTPSQTGSLFVRVARLPPETDRIAKVESTETESKRVYTVARRLYGGHTHLGTGQQGNTEDEQTRRR